MKELLLNCFYDKMTLGEAVAFVTRMTGKGPTNRSIKAAQNSIKLCTGIEWNGDRRHI